MLRQLPKMAILIEEDSCSKEICLHALAVSGYGWYYGVMTLCFVTMLIGIMGRAVADISKDQPTPIVPSSSSSSSSSSLPLSLVALWGLTRMAWLECSWYVPQTYQSGFTCFLGKFWTQTLICVKNWHYATIITGCADISKAQPIPIVLSSSSPSFHCPSLLCTDTQYTGCICIAMDESYSRYRHNHTSLYFNVAKHWYYDPPEGAVGKIECGTFASLNATIEHWLFIRQHPRLISHPHSRYPPHLLGSGLGMFVISL